MKIIYSERCVPVKYSAIAMLFLICLFGLSTAEVTTYRIELDPFFEAEFSGTTIPPKAVSQPQPVYPDSALFAGIEGEAKVHVRIDTTGTILDVEVMEVPAEGYGFEESLKEAISGWKFEPARNVIDDEPVEIMVNLTVEFSIMPKDLLNKADEMFNSRQYEESRDVYHAALKAAEKDSDVSTQVEALSQIARTHLIVGEKEPGREWFGKAVKLASPEDNLGWSRFLGVRGRFEWQDGDLEKSKATFEEMYRYCSERELHSRAIDAAHMVAIVGTPEEQIEWGLKGIAEAEAGDVQGWLGPLWNNLGATYEDQKKYTEALDAYKKARYYHYEHGDEMNRLIADWAVGHAYRLAGDLEEADKWLRPLLEWCERIEATEFLGWTHKELGEIALINGDKSSAKDHFTIALEKLEAEGMKNWDPNGFEELKKRTEELE